tara:strand:- start:1138 stop:1353 length:216 start_codon:yes stop_codon:yes gene_type:complete
MTKNATVNCPKCKEVFKVDDSVYTNIVKQVRDQQFQEEVSNRLAIAENEKYYQRYSYVANKVLAKLHFNAV